MSFYMEGDKQIKQAIRKEMLREADEMLKPLYLDTGQRHAAARVMVDRALAKERHEHNERPQAAAFNA